jgi:hypothetical protein
VVSAIAHGIAALLIAKSCPDNENRRATVRARSMNNVTAAESAPASTSPAGASASLLKTNQPEMKAGITVD